MKRIIMTAILGLLLVGYAGAGDLFFSEYIEGSSNNKAIEIYNASGAEVDLSSFTIKASNNGYGWGFSSSTGEADTRYSLPLTGTLAAGDVYVIYNAAATSPEIISAGDLALTFDETTNGSVGSNVPSFNGNDALGLFKNEVLIDVIGVPNESIEWDVAGVSGATVNHTLVRKPTVTSGNNDWASSAGSSGEDSEWVVYDQDTFNNLGSHQSGIAVNLPPVASAGADQVVGYGANVILDGSASTDPDGSIVSYQWNQLAGATVTLSNASQAVAGFTAPSVKDLLRFELVVTDDSSATDRDTIEVSVVNDSPSGVFISQYVEGSSNNKYLEIYNGTDATVDLNAAAYAIRISYNGANNFQHVISDWGSFKLLQPGAVIVMANPGHALYSSPDTTIYYINFNGNDGVGLFRDGLLVDLIGDPTSSDYFAQNMTLQRKSTVTQSNSCFSWTEWTQMPQDDISGLGSHVMNPNAPNITNVGLSQDFYTSAEEIEVHATIIPVSGEIASAVVKYGTSGALINEADMWLESGNEWAGNIPPQAGNILLEYKITATDNSSNSGESPVASVLVADADPLPIADLRSDLNSYLGQLQTISGVVTIGSGVIDNLRTKVYLQDGSGKGLNLFGYDLIPGINRGDELIVIGIVELYSNVAELTDFAFKVLSTGNGLPDAETISISAANSLDWEGTLVKFHGLIADTVTSGGGTSLKIGLGADTATVRIWGSTGINVTELTVGSSYWFQGVINPYYEVFQLLVGYTDDIWRATGIETQTLRPYAFQLNPAYPNPFNPGVQLGWQLDRATDFEIAVYNMLGQQVAILQSGYALPGVYQTNWNAGNLPSGAYFVQLTAGNRKTTQKIMLLK
jgi:hypothetical protein